MSDLSDTHTLPKGYEPLEIESRWKTFWETSKCFSPTVPNKHSPEKKPYSIVIPPPNVTGNLHMGHALNLTLQDMLCRHARQLGKEVLWVPGEDHAGIATQNVVERRLAEEGKSRHDLGRERFIERVWQWKEEYGENIRRQIKAMGASVDWSRERFTMDEGLSKAVRRVFVRLYQEGSIYKGSYIINWCSRCHTALADDEVEYTPQKTSLWHIAYPLDDGSASLPIATTRPETILGDTAVCVHPEDERYTSFIGRFIRLPLTNRLIPIIADNYVDRTFGTGALKVTPSHDHNDWNLGHKHSLDFLQVIDETGHMNEAAGVYAGLSKEEAREKIIGDLKNLGLLERVEAYDNKVGHCYRCSTIIEPHVSTQWFVAVKSLAEKARAAIPEETQIIPDSWTKTYYAWLDNIRDWCISRQIWWGHRIPAWTCNKCGQLTVAEETPRFCPLCNSSELLQDEDVLDTWFSSALWPFSTLGWPDDTWELQQFYPTSVLVTAFDILFFWIARMMMMGLHFMGKVPFRHVYIHALVRDAEGKKMSKSTGNVIDPLQMIAKYGTDSLRFTLAAFAAMGRDVRLSEDRIEGYRHFMNKIWNAARFILLHLERESAPPPVPLDNCLSLHHGWILHRLEELKSVQLEALAEYRFNDVAQTLYRFVWNEFCDWYLEIIKIDMHAGGERQNQARYIAWLVFQETLLLLHPIVPFISSELWQALPGEQAHKNLALQAFPAQRPGCLDKIKAGDMELLQDIITTVRTMRAELNISPALKLELLIKAHDASTVHLLTRNKEIITFLGRLKDLQIDAAATPPKASASHMSRGCELIIFLEGALDFTAELKRIEKELHKLETEQNNLDKKLRNEQYVTRAPQEIVKRDKMRTLELQETITKLHELRSRFQEFVI